MSDALDTAASSSSSPSSLHVGAPAGVAPGRHPALLPRPPPRARVRRALDLFVLDPALAHHELAPAAFEALFAPQLLPIMRYFPVHRASVVAAAAAATGNRDEDGEAAPS